MTNEAFDRADRVEEALDVLSSLLNLMIDLGQKNDQRFAVRTTDLIGAFAVMNEKVDILKEGFQYACFDRKPFGETQP